MVGKSGKLVATCILALYVMLVRHGLAMAVHPSECRKLMDLYIVADGSDSIMPGNFSLLKNTISGLVREIEIGPTKARLGMLVYSSNVDERNKHPFYEFNSDVIYAAAGLKQPRDGTATHKGISHMIEQFTKYGRPNVPWVCLVITDGNSKSFDQTVKQARRAQKHGISMFAVGVGHSINRTELEAIASSNRQFLMLDSFSELAYRLSGVMTRICPCPKPPTLPLAKCMEGTRSIGAMREYQCLDGYLQQGDPTISCRDDSTWSPLSSAFKCVPCSKDVPTVQHASCGGVEHTIGTIRSYTCNSGYLLRGNPKILCRNDATWSIPDFQCVPCGKTPTVTNGICGVGDYTIGSPRVFTCEPGYLAVGNPKITCLADATWSVPDFKCIPCGKTPNVENGICGGGDYKLGSRRIFSCKPGYFAVGNPDITCLSDATWSVPNFKCIPCGKTPDVENGICGGGEYLIGSPRIFTCKPGYLAVGNPKITCLSDATWSVPDFRCIPCGNTPNVENGICGGGDYKLGSRRIFSCKPGYFAVGNPDITCMPDATWSVPDFKCIPCGKTPDVENGICGGGDYLIGSPRIFTCKPGYLAVGNPKVTCLPDATWSVPDFKCIPCGKTPNVENGICGGGDYKLGSQRIFTCKPGYFAVGNPDITCLADATWSVPDFKCIPCGKTPDVENGICGGGEYLIGSPRIFTCKPGYLAVGNPKITCLPDATWSAPDFKCIPCGKTPNVENGICGGGDYKLGSRRIFSCKPGYFAVGNPDITCLADATWSVPNFKCIPCGKTPDVENGICGGGDYLIGSPRIFTCKPGYLAVGNPNIMCMDDATWSIPDFKCIPCGKTPDVENGICGGGDYRLGSRRIFSCKPGYFAVGNPDITCLADATWSVPDFKCIPCGKTPDVENGICGGGDYLIGSPRTFTCNPGYLAVGNPKITCLPDATWSVPDFKCIPCGKTPDVENGICGGGDYKLGSRRIFSCKPGYFAVGNPDITCLADATWSVPDFKCIPCGKTPDVENGICGGGEYLIGSPRIFTCKPGYFAVGDPKIMCMDDATWSLPDFKCIPCGDTPLIDHGSCGAGEYTLGSRRSYQCEPGYAAIGNPQIFCQDNATWSILDFKCIPCGDTPVVPNGICGGGEYLVGSRRTFTCNKGYRPQGNPSIECLPTGQWSDPAIQCLDCGPPPKIPNAYAQLGPSLIGSKREYHCEAGYYMYGTGQIKCDRNGQWTKPKFTCMVKTTTRRPPPTPIKGDPTVCDRCRYLNGVGYSIHPYDCNQYVQCFVGRRGFEPVYRKCPFGMFWDHNVLTCRPSNEVDCPHDKCKDPRVRGYKNNDLDSCCSYWKCDKGRAYGECCGSASSYNPRQGRCVHDEKCQAPCPYKDEIPVCDKQPAILDTMYRQHVGNNRWIDLPCAPGTAYNPVDCACSLHIMTVPGKRRQQVCRPELHLPFTKGFADQSGRNVHVYQENVQIHNGSAFFDGSARIVINRFSNTEFRGDLVIKFRYNEILEGPTANKLQALVTNGDCGSDPSIIIAKMPGYVLLGAKTNRPKSFALPSLDKKWKEVIYIHNGQRLEGKVCGASTSKWSWGPIQSTHCAMQIGHGSKLNKFMGYIDDFLVYQCRPREHILNINY